jgi:hypothetical protein
MRPGSGTLPVAAGPRLRDRLAAVPDGPLPVLHSGPHAVYLTVSGAHEAPWCLGIVASGAAAVPNALRLAFTDLRSLDPGAAHLVDGAVRLGGITLRVARLVDIRVPDLRVPAAAVRYPGTLIDRVGSGDGLTPYADDVLCGWLAVQRAAGRTTPDVDAAVRAASSRTTLLSATLLDCALHGEVLPELAAYLSALGTPQQARCEAALAAVGESSGRGLLEGARLALGGRAAAA